MVMSFSRFTTFLSILTTFSAFFATINYSASQARGDLILELSGQTNFLEGDTVVILDVIVKAVPNSISKTSFTASFSLLDGGLFAPNDNGFGDGGGFLRTGDFGKDGFIGYQNLQATSFFVADPDDPRFAEFSLDFTANELFPTEDRLLTRLTIDISGLQPGTFGIEVFSDHTQMQSFNLGSFTVSAVPEPSSMLLLFASTGLIAIRGRRRLKAIFRK